MSGRTADELLAAYLEGTLDAAGERELLALLQADPALAQRLREHLALEAGLKGALDPWASSEATVRAVLERLKGAGSETAFARRVVSRLGAKRRERPGPRPALWLGVAAAAALVFGAVMLSSLPSKKAPTEPRLVRTPEPAPQPEPPVRPELPEREPLRPLPVPEPRPLPRPEAPAPRPVVPVPPRTAEVPVPPKPPATVTEAPKPPAALAGGKPVPEGGSLETGATERVLLVFPDGTTAELRGKAGLAEIRFAATGPEFRLQHGAVWVAAAKQAEGRRARFTAPHAEARVLGTLLRLSTASEGSRLEVYEGRVDFAGTTVKEHETALAAPGRAIEVGPLPAPKGTALAAYWLAAPGSAAAVDERLRQLRLPTGTRIESTSSWNLVEGTFLAGGELRWEGEGKGELRFRLTEHTTPGPDNVLELVLRDGEELELRVQPGNRRLQSAQVREKRGIPFELELSETRVRLLVGGRPFYEGAHGIGGFGILHPAWTAEGGAAGRIHSPVVRFAPKPR